MTLTNLTVVWLGMILFDQRLGVGIEIYQDQIEPFLGPNRGQRKLFGILGEAIGSAQSSVKPPANPLTLDQAVDFALANYPAVRASMERSLASKVGVAKLE